MDKEKLWRKLQEHLGYSDAELTTLRANPKWVKMVEETPQFITHKIIAEVIESHGCHAQHKVGQRIVMNGNGQLIRDECPERICVFAVGPLEKAVMAIYERFTAQLDPNGLLFDRVTCTDVGPDCGGWGRILMKISVEGPQ